MTGFRINHRVAPGLSLAIGAILALKQAGVDPKTIYIGGIEATADGLAEVANGSLHATVFQNAKGQGRGAVDTALQLIKGEKVPSYVDVPFEKVTKDNYKDCMAK